MTVNIVVRVYNAKAQKRDDDVSNIHPSIHPASQLSHRPITTHLHTFRRLYRLNAGCSSIYKYDSLFDLRYRLAFYRLGYVENLNLAGHFQMAINLREFETTYRETRMRQKREREQSEAIDFFGSIAWCRGTTGRIFSFLPPPQLRHIGGSVLYI